MKDGFRQSMAWLHTWSGLLMGWLLFVMFACGTSAYFQEEITRWMLPEVVGEADPDRAAASAVQWLSAHAPPSSDWYISLPGKRSAVTTVYWEPLKSDADHRETEAKLDSLGRPVTARDTAGGFFLYRFHFDLHYLPVIWARYIVGIAAMFMLVAILSGIITHKKIFADFFMLRFGKGQRSWLDAHNVTAVLALPFHLMITYTGLVTLDNQLAPAPVAALYQSRQVFYAEAFPDIASGPAVGSPAALAAIGPMLQKAHRVWGDTGIGTIHVAHPGDAAARVTLQSSAEASMDARGQTLRFDGVRGTLIGAAAPRGGARLTEGVMIGLHAGRYADIPLRWLYFLSGLGGTVMIGTGLILWTVKRRAKLPDPTRPHLGFRVVERLNIAVIIGFPIGLACYFLANRLLPLHLAERADREIASLFIAWGLATTFALARPARRAWIELCAAVALLFGSVPVVNALTTSRGLPVSLMHGDWVFAGFDLVMLAISGLMALASWKTTRATPATDNRRPSARSIPL